jgi:flagellar protein FlgJ
MAITPTSLSNLAPAQDEADTWLDVKGLTQLKADARGKDARDPATLKAVAQQFESLFLGMMLKSMRDANFDDSNFESDETKFYQDLFDKQISLNLSQGRGLGVAEMLVRQLGQQLPAGAAGAAPLLAPAVTTATTRTAGAAPALPVTAATTFEVPVAPDVATAVPSSGGGLGVSPTEFVRQVLPHAQAAASALGVNPLALVAHAALETGWGRHVPAQSAGTSSFNLFGVKATDTWDGARTTRDTLEFEGGTPVRRREAFRAYESLAEGFSDYVKLLKSSPRYAGALQAGNDPRQFAIELQRAGYATDPAYSKKIEAILHSDQLREAIGSLKTDGDLPTL